jgi:hypothetical protein
VSPWLRIVQDSTHAWIYGKVELSPSAEPHFGARGGLWKAGLGGSAAACSDGRQTARTLGDWSQQEGLRTIGAPRLSI